MQKEELVEMLEYILDSNPEAPSAHEIMEQCLDLAGFLVTKNRKYGDSALNPFRYHARTDVTEQIRVRMDDKLNRMCKGQQADDEEDPARDYVGYWVLLRIAEKREREALRQIPTKLAKALAEKRGVLSPQTTPLVASDPGTMGYYPKMDRTQDLVAWAGSLTDLQNLADAAAVQELRAADIEAKTKLEDELCTPSALASAYESLVRRRDAPGPTYTEQGLPAWQSNFGPVCSVPECNNRTGNSDRSVCPPCMRKGRRVAS